jgi:hypothetical protein
VVLAFGRKVHSIAYVRQHGQQTATTCTANPAMPAINEKLGYRREQAEIRLVKALMPAGTTANESTWLAVLGSRFSVLRSR